MPSLQKPLSAEALKLPAALPLWELCVLKIGREELCAVLGKPHFTETNEFMTAGGEEDAWAYLLPGGQRVLIIMNAGAGQAVFSADPPDLEPLLAEFRLPRDHPHLVIPGLPNPLR